MPPSLPYVIHPAEPGAQAELYLPKKALYQGGLYDTLTAGFELEHLRAHFRDPAKRPRIADLLRRHDIEPLSPDQIVQTCWGYSLYEMDGVFKTSDPARRGQVDEERVQVVRLIFRPDMDEVLRLQPDGARARQIVQILQAQGAQLGGGLGALGPLSEADQRLIGFLQTFFASVRLFLVGYLLFEICDRLWQLNQELGLKLEDEIWVTLSPNLSINRLVVPDQTGGGA